MESERRIIFLNETKIKNKVLHKEIRRKNTDPQIFNLFFFLFLSVHQMELFIHLNIEKKRTFFHYFISSVRKAAIYISLA
jgi:hypothetical protein